MLDGGPDSLGLLMEVCLCFSVGWMNAAPAVEEVSLASQKNTHLSNHLAWGVTIFSGHWGKSLYPVFKWNEVPLNWCCCCMFNLFHVSRFNFAFHSVVWINGHLPAQSTFLLRVHLCVLRPLVRLWVCFFPSKEDTQAFFLFIEHTTGNYDGNPWK